MPRGIPRAKAEQVVEAKADEDVVESAETEVVAAKASDGLAVYESVGEVMTSFDILIAGEWYKGAWNRDRTKLRFKIPVDVVDRMEQHHHVVTGRVKRCD